MKDKHGSASQIDCHCFLSSLAFRTVQRPTDNVSVPERNIISFELESDRSHISPREFSSSPGVNSAASARNVAKCANARFI